MKIYQKIAQTLQSMKNCENSNNSEWYFKHKDILCEIEKEYFPSGSGFDSDCYTNQDLTDLNKITITFDWHCMNDTGYYDGWLKFDIVIKPDFQDFTMKINWFKYNMDCRYKVQKYKPILEDYFYDTWYDTLNSEYERE